MRADHGRDVTQSRTVPPAVDADDREQEQTGEDGVVQAVAPGDGHPESEADRGHESATAEQRLEQEEAPGQPIREREDDEQEPQDECPCRRGCDADPEQGGGAQGAERDADAERLLGAARLREGRAVGRAHRAGRTKPLDHAGSNRMPAPWGPWNSYCTGLQWVRTAPAADHAILGAPRCIQVPPGIRGRAASEQRLPPPTGISGAAAGGTPGTQCRSRTERMEDLLARGT